MRVADKIRKNLLIHMARWQSGLLSSFDQTEIETIAGNVAQRGAGAGALTYAHALISRSETPNEFALNGEQWLLDRLQKLQFHTLFDAGANIGIWSSHAAKVFPVASLHAFEPVPGTFAQLRANLPDEPRIVLNNLGLSDRDSEITINTYSSHFISSMFTVDNDPYVTGQIQCRVTRGADYAAQNGMDRIDILKIDVEGAEGLVLDGFEPMLSEHRVRLVQFEYNRGAILGDFLLKHAYRFFGDRRYRLGRLLPDRVDFHDYHLSHEDFVGPNYVAIAQEDTELAALLAGS